MTQKLTPEEKALRWLNKFMENEIGWSGDRPHYRWVPGPDAELMRKGREILREYDEAHR